MRTPGIRLRLLVIIAVVVSCVWAIVPPSERITLGLDLAGGVHIVLRVQTDDALAAETRQASERVRAALDRLGAGSASIAMAGPAAFVVGGAADAVLREAAAGEPLFEVAPAGRGLDGPSRERYDGGPPPRGLRVEMRPPDVQRLRDRTVEQAIAILDRRINALGIAEAQVGRYTARDQVLVQLPGVSDVASARRVLQSTAQLRLTLVEAGPFATRDAALQAYVPALPPHLELLPGRAPDDPSVTVHWVVHRSAPVAGDDVRAAQQSTDEYSRPAVAFTLTDDAARRFGAFTGEHVNRLLATVLDDRVMSVATIVSRIAERGQIVGLSREEMIDQVVTLQSGALPADLDYLYHKTVSASLGEASIRAGVLASAGGLVLVALFMLAYYRMAGLNAVVSIALNLLLLVALMTLLGGVLTLPGIAGLILTIGMGVDSNVLIFERIREELATARGPRAAVHAGFDRVWITIVDTHVASLLAAAFLFQFGTSAIRGFATTLTLGLAANVFTSVFVSRTLFDIALARRGARSAGG